MKRKGHIAPLMNTRLARVIVVFFLLFCGADLMNPQLCDEEFGDVVNSAAAAPLELDAGSSNAFMQRVDFQQQQQPEPSEPQGEEDCFCCCAHVLPGLMTHPDGSSNAVSLSFVADPEAIVSADLPTMYHPPRFS